MATYPRVLMSSQVPKKKFVYSHSKNQRIVVNKQFSRPFQLSSVKSRRSTLSTAVGFGNHHRSQKGKTSMQGFSNIIDNFGSQSKGNFIQSVATRHPPVNNSNFTPKKSSIPLIPPPKRQFLTTSQSIKSENGSRSRGRNAPASSKSISSLHGGNIASKETNRNLTAASRTSATKSGKQSGSSQARSSTRSHKTSSTLSKPKSKVNDGYSPRLQPIVENTRPRQHTKRTTTDISRLYAFQTPFVVTTNNKNQSQNDSRQEHDRYRIDQMIKKEPKPSLPVPTLKSRVPKSVFSTVIVGSNKFDKSASDVEDDSADKSPSRKTNNTKVRKEPKKSSKLLPSYAKSRNGRGAASDSDLSQANKNPGKNSKTKNAIPFNPSYYDAHGVNMPASLGAKKWASEEKLQKSPYKVHQKVNPNNEEDPDNSTSPRSEEGNNSTDRSKISSNKHNSVISQANELLIKGWSQIYGKPLKSNYLRDRIAEKVKLAQKEQQLRAKIKSKSENRQLEAKKKQKKEDVTLIQDKYDNGLQKRYANTHMSMKALVIAVIAGMRLKNGWMPDVDKSQKAQPLYATIPLKKPQFDKEGSTTSSRNSIVPSVEEGNKFLPALSPKPNSQLPLNDNKPIKSIFDLRSEQDESILPQLSTPPALSKSLSALQNDYELPKTPDFLNRQPLFLDDDDDDDDININKNKNKIDDDKSVESDKSKHVKFSDDDPKIISGYSDPRTSALSVGSSVRSSPLSKGLSNSSSRDNGLKGLRKLASPAAQDKSSNEAEDSVAKRLAALKKTAKIASGNNSLRDSPNGLEQRLNENKLPDDNDGGHSSRNSVVDIPESIQQRLNRLKSKNNLNGSHDTSGSDHGDSRRDSLSNLASSARDNSSQGSRKLASPEEKPLETAEDPIAKRLAELKKGAKIAGTPSNLLDSSNGLEQRLNENKLPDENDGGHSSRNSVVDIPESIQQRLNRLKSKNNLNGSHDTSSSDHGDSRRDSLSNLASSARDNSSQGSRKLASPEEKPLETAEDPIAKRLAELKKGAKIAGTPSNLLDSSNGLEQRLNENKLPDENKDDHSSRNSVVDIPDSIQQRLDRLKSKNNLNASHDASGSDQGDGRRDSLLSLASSIRDNSSQGSRKLASPDEKPSESAEDPIAKRLAELKKGAKIDGTSSSILDSSNELEQRLKDNKLVDHDEDSNSNKDTGSLTDIPDTIQQRLEQLKLKTKPTSATDNASNGDYSEGRPNSIFSSDSSAIGQKRTGLGSASSGYASEGVNHLPSTATDPIRILPNISKDNDNQNNEIKGISPAVTSSLQARLARLRSNLDNKKRGGRTYKPLSRGNSRQRLLGSATPTGSLINASETPSNFNIENYSAGSKRSSLYETDTGVQKKLEMLKNNLNEGSGLESRSGNSRVGSRRTSLFDHEDEIAKKLEDLKNNLDGTTPGLFQSSALSYGGSNVGSRRTSLFDNDNDIKSKIDSLRNNVNASQELFNNESQDNLPHKLNGLRTKTAIEV